MGSLAKVVTGGSRKLLSSIWMCHKGGCRHTLCLWVSSSLLTIKERWDAVPGSRREWGLAVTDLLAPPLTLPHPLSFCFCSTPPPQILSSFPIWLQATPSLASLSLPHFLCSSLLVLVTDPFWCLLRCLLPLSSSLPPHLASSSPTKSKYPSAMTSGCFLLLCHTTCPQQGKHRSTGETSFPGLGSGGTVALGTWKEQLQKDSCSLGLEQPLLLWEDDRHAV